jgi:predicted nucleic acid-binding Zn ribbon protein
MEHLQSLLKKTLARTGMQEHVEAAIVVHRAAQWCREHLPHVAAQLTVERLENGTLIIMCKHPAVAQEVMAQSQDLLQFLASDDVPKVERVRCVAQ